MHIFIFLHCVLGTLPSHTTDRPLPPNDGETLSLFVLAMLHTSNRSRHRRRVISRATSWCLALKEYEDLSPPRMQLWDTKCHNAARSRMNQVHIGYPSILNSECIRGTEPGSENPTNASKKMTRDRCLAKVTVLLWCNLRQDSPFNDRRRVVVGAFIYQLHQRDHSFK